MDRGPLLHDLRKEGFHGVRLGARHGFGKMLSDQLLRRVAQQVARLRTDIGKDAVRIHLPDPVRGGLHQIAETFLAGFKCRIGFDAFGDVARNPAEPGKLPSIVGKGPTAHFKDDLAAILVGVGVDFALDDRSCLGFSEPLEVLGGIRRHHQ